MIIGYARVSTKDQDLTAQREAIERYAEDQGQELILYEEKQSGGKKDRQELQNALKALQKGNTFVVYKLDRLARSTKQLFDVSDLLEKKGVHFVSLSDNIDTTTAAGKAMFGMMAVFAEFEREIIRERTQCGLESARRKGRTGGRPQLPPNKKKQIRDLMNQGHRAKDIAKEYDIGVSTVYKIMKEGE